MEIITSTEGSQQGDQSSSFEYCDAVQPTLLKTNSRADLRCVHDIKLEGKISTVAKDVQHVVDSFPTTDLQLNAHKFELICNNFDLIDNIQSLGTLPELPKEDLTIRGAPVFEGNTIDCF